MWRGHTVCDVLRRRGAAFRGDDGTETLVASIDVSLRGALRPLTPLLAPMYRRMPERDLDRVAELLVAA